MKISQLPIDAALQAATWFPVARDGKNYRLSGAVLMGMFAAADHKHAASDITSGTLVDARIPALAASKVTSGVFAVARLGTGTASTATYLRGDGTWTAPPFAATSHTHAATDITSGTLADARIPALAASKVTSGVFAVARLGSGTASASTYLRGDGAWATLPAFADASHTHDAADVASGVFAVARLGTGTASTATYLRGDGAWTAPPFAATSHTHAATDITSGTLADARIPALAASKVTSGIFATARLGSGTPTVDMFLRGDGVWAVPPVGSGSGSDPETHYHAASDITSGVFAVARLGTGTASTSTYLRGDGTWTAPPFAATSHTHAATDITSGTLADARIPALAASKVTSGVFAVARLGSGTASTATYLRGDGAWTAPPFAATSHTHAASAVTSGVFAPARLGTGAASASTFLRGDGVWASPAGGGSGGGGMQTWYGNFVPNSAAPGGGFVQISWNDQLMFMELCVAANDLSGFAGAGTSMQLQNTVIPAEVSNFFSGGGFAQDSSLPGVYSIKMVDIMSTGNASGAIQVTNQDEGATNFSLNAAAFSGQAIAGWRGTAMFHRMG